MGLQTKPNGVVSLQYFFEPKCYSPLALYYLDGDRWQSPSHYNKGPIAAAWWMLYTARDHVEMASNMKHLKGRVMAGSVARASLLSRVQNLSPCFCSVPISSRPITGALAHPDPPCGWQKADEWKPASGCSVPSYVTRL